MYKIFLLTLLTISINSRNSFCPWGNYPVCGVDYKTYANQCALQIAYVEFKHVGACKKIRNEAGEYLANCPQIFEPVCGRDGVTYMNECRLEANNVVAAFKAPCTDINYVAQIPPLECNCLSSPFRPICSMGGDNYENECVLNCTQQISSNNNAPCSSACECPKKYVPVCGVDGLTYDNKCTLDCVKVLKQGNGECPSILNGCQYCSDVFMPVCGANSKTYRNLCELKCNGQRFDYFGKCQEVLITNTNCNQCSDVFMPICGSDGINYQNECKCACKGNCSKYSEGECPMQQNACTNCANELAPVCGNDGVTYDNSCLGQCAGAEIVNTGYCGGSTFY